jgi:hypothetical protein
VLQSCFQLQIIRIAERSVAIPSTPSGVCSPLHSTSMMQLAAAQQSTRSTKAAEGFAGLLFLIARFHED